MLDKLNLVSGADVVSLQDKKYDLSCYKCSVQYNVNIITEVIILNKVASATVCTCRKGKHFSRVQVGCSVGFHLELI